MGALAFPVAGDLAVRLPPPARTRVAPALTRYIHGNTTNAVNLKIPATWACALLAIAAAQPSTRPANDGSLKVSGDVEHPLTLSPVDLAAMAHVDLKFKPHHGAAEATYSGVPLREILLKAGLPLGKDRLRGPSLSRYALVVGADGYRALFALPEFDADYRDRQILLADKRDGQPLDDKEGPLRLIVADEAMQARDVRQVTEVRLGRAEP